MPAHQRSLRITDSYRARLAAVRAQAVQIARQSWRRLDPADLDTSHAAWVAAVGPVLMVFRRAGVRVTDGYLTAFIRSELGRAGAAPPPLAGPDLTLARSGVTLDEALVPSLFTVKRAIGEGQASAVALGLGLDRATRLVADEVIAPARDVLADGIQRDDRIVGWRRVSGGGCGACDAAATGAIQADDELLEVHPHCSCSKEPVVADVPDAVQRPTGEEMFNALSSEAQDAMLGAEKADLIRSGAVPFKDLIQRDPMAATPDGITEAPLDALKH